jgi:hypothetical protein
MGTLMKYEFRKTWKMKGIILCITAFFQLVFSISVVAKSDGWMGLSVTGLAFTAICSVFLIGVHGIHILSRDINTKQSYMLFMTPNSSYKILGAKTLENGLSVIIAGVFYTVLAIADITILAVRYDDVKAFLDLFNVILKEAGTELTAYTFSLTMIQTIISWVFLISMGYLAVVICATLLLGNRFNGVLSLIVFFLIAFVVGNVSDALQAAVGGFSGIATAVDAAFHIILTAVMYFITAWIMDNKLSV